MNSVNYSDLHNFNPIKDHQNNQNNIGQVQKIIQSKTQNKNDGKIEENKAATDHKLGNLLNAIDLIEKQKETYSKGYGQIVDINLNSNKAN